MSFGASNTTKTAENNLGGTSNAALNTLFPAVTSAGGTALDTGANNISSGTNFFNTLLGGNTANTTAALQPSIDQIRAGTTGNINAINTLTPRGGGRSGALFSQSFQPQQQIQSLFNGARTQAAQTLPQIGLQQQGLGANLFGIGNGALGTAANANSSLGNMGLQQQQINNQLMTGLGGGLFSILGLPTGGGSGNSVLGAILKNNI